VAVAGGKHVRKPHEAWIAVDPRGIVRVLMTGSIPGPCNEMVYVRGLVANR
jgi:hypothetical protein